MRKLLLLGASGNIGKQVIDIIRDNPSFRLVGISVGNNLKRGYKILSLFDSIKFFYSINEVDEQVRKKYKNVSFFYGEDGLENIVKLCDFDLLINALVGFVGLLPTLTALNKNKTVCLANKESLVVGGELVYKLINEGKGQIIPIDSEHVAIDKCLRSSNKKIKRIVLTASGGAFRNLSHKQIGNKKSSDALKHPTWNMGNKITIDSATMINKCFEIIEAHYMFSNFCDKIDVLLHYESMIHSMVQYSDNTYRAEISKPDMHNPISYAVYERNEIITTYTAKKYKDFGSYTFKRASFKRFPLLAFANDVINKKGLYGCALNAANEVCVEHFLKDEISLLDLEHVIKEVMENVPDIHEINYAIIKENDSKFRDMTLNLIRKLR